MSAFLAPFVTSKCISEFLLVSALRRIYVLKNQPLIHFIFWFLSCRWFHSIYYILIVQNSGDKYHVYSKFNYVRLLCSEAISLVDANKIENHFRVTGCTLFLVFHSLIFLSSQKLESNRAISKFTFLFSVFRNCCTRAIMKRKKENENRDCWSRLLADCVNRFDLLLGTSNLLSFFDFCRVFCTWERFIYRVKMK